MTKQDCIDVLTGAGYRDYGDNSWDYDGIYELHYGEYERPVYRVRHRAHGCWGIKVEYYYYSRVFGAKEDHFLSEEEMAYLGVDGCCWWEIEDLDHLGGRYEGGWELL